MQGVISMFVGAALAAGVVLLFWLLFSTADGLYRLGRRPRPAVWLSLSPGYRAHVEPGEKDRLLERIDEALDDSPKGRSLEEVVESLPPADADDDPNPSHRSNDAQRTTLRPPDSTSA